MRRALLLLLVIALHAPTFGHSQTEARLPDTVIPAQDLAPTKARSYNWWARHDGVLQRLRSGPVDLLLIGDSITHLWGGEPAAGGNNGPGSGLWQKYFGSRNAVNEGFGWDRTQHVLWRFDHGELDGVSPKVATVMIGTNNIGSNTSADIAAGVDAIVDEIHTKLPRTKILLLGIFPRDPKPDSKNRLQVVEVNTMLARMNGKRNVTYLDFSSKFLQPDGALTREMMPDYLHPSPKGYQIWADAMEPTLAKLMHDTPRPPGN